MGDMGEDFRAMRDDRNARRAKYGVDCPRCAEVRPRAPASILLPQQRCRVDGYVDPRSELTDEQWNDV
ncbi:Uncharacterized protein MCB1EB_1527 [Mycoavidus cysteinexigens]|uniref:Uncharacterized protein n=1 Tax=Mycoavidus cysteinexigens TaxID=1553431 RepID=A0A2Z6EW00_9BURK|nr:hypothetical protein [Mycoavidus cysteinexigens]BBE09576.1 Uncharacterized protein MCB1EB_1415 [Mycoavidus cysteinexigens]BBE09631.1 Uncharacterized protein MCB1EB_1470 [Mycoavidus cysteinexigens]BBE09688.1 Uncharacterized protein MCB1EB_1527 [Mycoavidus cysteinexigens]GLR01042.1 hypothetical protein GCM10007934_08540 [Mycoavidus cysteinexigens]